MRGRNRVIALTIAVAIVAAIPFLPALQNGFVSWDDDKNFLANTAYRGLGWAQLKWMWTTFHLGHYVPLSWMTLGLDYAVWGMDARGYHFTSIVLHAANAALLFLLARRILALASRSDRSDASIVAGALVASLWFAVHPLRVESVAWATERRDVLSGVFYSATVLAYLAFTESRATSRYALAVALFAAALLSKASAMTVPAALALLNVYPLRRLRPFDWKNPENRPVVREVLPFAALSLAAMALSLIALKPGEQLGFGDKVIVSAYGLWFYVSRTIVPIGLAAYYPLPREIDAGATRFLLGYATTLALLAAIAFTAIRRRTGVAVALTGFVAFLLPTLGVVQNGPQLVADRYAYQAASAIALLIGALVALGWRHRRILTLTISIAVLAMLGARTWVQTQYWRDSLTLWTRVLEISDDAAIAHNALGNLQMSDSRWSLAVVSYERAVQLDPRLASAHDNLGVALSRLGRADEAISHFESAAVDRDEADKAYNNWGVTLLSQGELDGAADKFSRAIELDSLNAGAETNLGSVFARAGRLEDAAKHFERAARVRPDLAQARANWGAVLARMGRWDEARIRLAEAAALDSTDTDVRAALAAVDAELKKRASTAATAKP